MEILEWVFMKTKKLALSVQVICVFHNVVVFTSPRKMRKFEEIQNRINPVITMYREFVCIWTCESASCTWKSREKRECQT